MSKQAPIWRDEHGAEIALSPREANLVRSVLALAVKGRRLQNFQIVLHVKDASVGWSFTETGTLEGQTSASGLAFNG